MNIEENRLRTFVEWPTTAAVDATRIAKAGFYYSGRALEVQCFLCGTKISDWNYGDQAMTRHRQAEPNCPFVKNPSSTCNIPLVPTSSSSETLQSSNLHDNEDIAPTTLHECENPRTKYRSLSERMESFVNWPISSIISPRKLAKAGFYYLQQGDMVECAFCEGILTKWVPGDDPDREHRIHFPKCNFYMHQENDNEKLEFNNVRLVPGTTVDPLELGIQTHVIPRKPKHATYEGRLNTFEGWPQDVKQTPDKLAAAGFYYVGSRDQVRCFHCDGGLCDWKLTDDPWVEHAAWFPKCGYVNLVQGQKFVKECVDNRPPLDPSILVGFSENENAEVTETPTTSVPTVLPPTQEVTDAVVEQLLNTLPAVAALEIGLHLARVTRALRRRMEIVGKPYTSADELIEDVLNDQFMEDDDGVGSQRPDSPSSELITLLDHIITGETDNNASRQPNTVEGNDVSQEIHANNDVTVPDKQDEKSEIVNKETKVMERKANVKLEDSVSLEEENRRLKEARLCKVCMDREVAIVFLPCGHLATRKSSVRSSRNLTGLAKRRYLYRVKKMTGIVERRDLVTDSSPFKPANPHLTPPPALPSVLIDEVDNVDYRFESARLQSFENWPVPFMEPEKLAAAGFYYIGEGDKVRCFECHVEISQWIEGDNPMVDHQRWSGRCRFIRKIPCGNVPIGVDPDSVPLPRPRSRDVCGPYGIEYRPGSGPDCHSFSNDLQLPSTAKLCCLGLGRPKGPTHPEYASYDARLRTFESWPKSMPQTKEQLADAGFYYTGKGDQTLCYYCGGGLKDWEPEDDPWEQHAKWFSKCYYLLMVQGQEYVNKITGQHMSPPSKEETMQMNLPSFIKKVEQPVTTEREKGNNGESEPGPSTGGPESQDSGIESIGSNSGSRKGSTEDLSNQKAQSSKSVDDARMCKICYNGELGVVFLPCGHIVACVKCAPAFHALSSTTGSDNYSQAKLDDMTHVAYQSAGTSYTNQIIYDLKIRDTTKAMEID
ncbi:hypothetical protein KM043_004667 [Ampulex compressa]|nr:hypothetical protein KM043_004667 [Ampulex compressa]